jgi:hypothetical protein
LIPLDVLEATNSVLHSDLTYTPKFAATYTPSPNLPIPYTPPSIAADHAASQQYDYTSTDSTATTAYDYSQQQQYDTQAATSSAATTATTQAAANTNYYTENDPWQVQRALVCITWSLHSYISFPYRIGSTSINMESWYVILMLLYDMCTCSQCGMTL